MDNDTCAIIIISDQVIIMNGVFLGVTAVGVYTDTNLIGLFEGSSVRLLMSIVFHTRSQKMEISYNSVMVRYSTSYISNNACN